MTAMRVPKAQIKNNGTFKEYYRTLLSEQTTSVKFNCIRSKNHQIYTLGVNKVGLSPFENKRYYIDNIRSLAYGHLRSLA
jgi:hypothetical protein